MSEKADINMPQCTFALCLFFMVWAPLKGNLNTTPYMNILYYVIVCFHICVNNLSLALCCFNMGQHSGGVVSAAPSQLDSPWLCGFYVWSMFSPCLCEFSPGAPVSSHSPKACN